MSFTVEQKSQLAKLMATENITIQHQKLRTAYFDPKNRVLYLPIWQNMDGDMYDLLGGHEVGHALYTPAEGWHNAVVNTDKPKSFKNFLNVVEDARIEKKVQRKYPGLKSSFRRAYAQLMAKDFFGIANRNIDKMAFIERLNIFTKSQYTMELPFSNEEQILIEKVKACETWEDVLRVTGEVFEYSKDEQYEMNLQDFRGMSSVTDDLDDEYDDYDDYDTFDEEQPEYDDDDREFDDNKNADGESSENENEQQSRSGNSDNDEEDAAENDDDDDSSFVNRWKESAPSHRDQYVPKCETDENFRQKEDLLLDEKCKDYVYVNFPNVIASEIFVSAKRVQEQLTEYYDERIAENEYQKEVNESVLEFKKNNERYVSLLAKEFEMRKAAKSFSKSKVSETGDIDITKLSSYKFDDNIFRKVMVVPKGKSHGLVLLLDYSGSMSNNMSGSIEQILVLTMFCRKVNIPFHVFAFSDSMDAHELDTQGLSKRDAPCFSNNLNEINMSQVYLREYMNSSMKNAEYSKAMRNMILLKNSYENNYKLRYLGRPRSEDLSNTPLTQDVYALGNFMVDFKRKNNLDLTSLVIVHDGDSDNISSYWTERNDFDYNVNATVKRKMVGSMNYNSNNIVLVDRKNKFQRTLTKDENMLTSTLEWFKAVTGSKVFGFFLVPMYRSNIRNALMNRYYFDDGSNFYERRGDLRAFRGNREEFNRVEAEIDSLLEDRTKAFRSEKFMISNNPGYNQFYLVAGGDELKIHDGGIEVEGKITTSKLKNAFMKMNKKKQINRVLVSKFITGMAI